MKKLLFLLFLISSACYGQFTKLQFYSKIDGLGNYNISIQKSFWDTLAVSVPFYGNFTAADFNVSSGNISLDYINGQAASSSVKGFLTNTDWSTFNNKQASLVSGTNIKTINGSSVLGSGDLTISGGVTSVSGTSGRITSTGGATPIIDLSATIEASFSKIVNRIDQNNASTTSAQLFTAIPDESGTGVLVGSASPAFTGTPTVPTPSALDNSQKIAPTNYVDAAIAAASGLTHNFIPVGNGSNVAVGVAMSGDMTINDIGVTTLTHDRLKLDGSNTATAGISLSGAFDFTFGMNRLLQTQSFTTTASNQFLQEISGTIQARSTASDIFGGMVIKPLIKSGGATQNAHGLLVQPTWDESAGALTTNNVATFTGTSRTVLISKFGSLRTSSGLSFAVGTDPSDNKILFSTSATGGLSGGTNGTYVFDFATSNTIQQPFTQKIALAPTSGALAFLGEYHEITVNETGSFSGSSTAFKIRLVPTAHRGNFTFLNFDTNAGITNSNTVIGINYNPTVTSIGTHYAALFQSGRVGIGTATPTASLQIAAGSIAASTAPLKFTSGSLMTSPEVGAIEFLTDKTYFTIGTGTARKEFTLNDAALTSGSYPVATTNGRLTDSKVTTGSFSGAGTATTVFTITIGITMSNSTYKVQVTPTSSLSAALFYVTNKTTTTFDVTYLAGLTGTVTFDWLVFP